MKNIKESIRQAVKDNLEKITSDRRQIHRHPELSFEEHETSAFVASRLDEMGISYKKGIAGTGIIATIEGKEKGKVIALRADMDALPIQEETGLSFA
ncbi:MAG: amidohydrolase, partial [Bacteroidota bacterium]